MADINEDELTLLVIAWGDKHIHYLERLALPSVFRNGNLSECGYKKFHVFGATVGNRNTLIKAIEKAACGVEIELHIGEYPGHNSIGVPLATIQPIRDVITFCIERKTRMLMVPSDTVFSFGSVYNLREYARNKVVSVAAPHLRVNEDTFLKSFDDCWPLKSSKMVGMAMDHAHQSLRDSFCDRENATNHGGISLRKIHPDRYTIIHYLPTPYLVWFNESDRQYFNRDIPCLGHWDHFWPRHLESEGRLRIVTSSDLFFALELTPPHMNIVNIQPGTAFEEDSNLGPAFMRCIVGGLFG